MAKYIIRPGVGRQLIVTGVRMRGKSLDKRITVTIDDRDDLPAVISGLVDELYPGKALARAIAVPVGERRVQQ